MNPTAGAAAPTQAPENSVHVPGATLRRLDEESAGLPIFAKSKVVLRDAEAVQRCGTTASDRTSISEGSQDGRLSKRSGRTDCDAAGAADAFDDAKDKLTQISNDLVIFDYDDTILPTFSLACAQKHAAGHQLLDPEQIQEELERLSDAVLANLNRVVSVATLLIVTNASSDWLAQSCERYLPKVAAFLAQHRIRIISARDRFDNSLLAQKHWKYFIFIDLIEEHFIDQLKSGEPFTVTSIGDGAEEREACMKVASIFKNQKWVFKNLKLLTQPSISCLIQQHVLLAKSFDSFFDMKTSADLCILFDKKSTAN